MVIDDLFCGPLKVRGFITCSPQVSSALFQSQPSGLLLCVQLWEALPPPGTLVKRGKWAQASAVHTMKAPLNPFTLWGTNLPSADPVFPCNQQNSSWSCHWRRGMHWNSKKGYYLDKKGKKKCHQREYNWGKARWVVSTNRRIKTVIKKPKIRVRSDYWMGLKAKLRKFRLFKKELLIPSKNMENFTWFGLIWFPFRQTCLFPWMGRWIRTNTI